MLNEIFKDIENYEGLYQVSNLGNIKSLHCNLANVVEEKEIKQEVIYGGMQMKKTIKVINLLNMISKGEEVPKKIKYRNKIYIKRSDCYWYILENGTFDDELFVRIDCLNDEVEIISDEEEFEDIYNFCWNENYLFSNRQTGMTKEDRRLLDSNFKDIYDTINKLIKNQKKIIERLKESE